MTVKEKYVELTDQQKKFVEGVANTGLICKSAELAGYSRWYGWVLLKDPKISDAITEANSDRSEDQARIYHDFCLIAEEAKRIMWETVNDTSATLEDKQLAMEGAARHLERVARANGMMIPNVQVNENNLNLSMQAIIQLVGQNFQQPQRIMDATAIVKDKPTNGTNGQNH